VSKPEAEGTIRRSGSLKESAEPLTDEEMATTTAPVDSELTEMSGSAKNNDNADIIKERFNDFATDEEDNEETAEPRGFARLYAYIGRPDS